ncbi:PASTA domain-containing protein [Robiginitalea myxolifaciens]|uniref:PASTA domain-containing protein n=1 Tax=Robiginitalea myxolifaciens TaxID=400055 RepID=A0A1I6FP80_9FLAO|nr:PASTA domain-containing protein [Robiginitalea myxolifaciens]SFR31751.1 PASTA domain-containing protein [Robiginitalea myxolifaciens]
MRRFFNFLRSRVFLINLGLALLAIVLITLATLQWLSSSTDHGEYVKVPDLAGLSVPDMRKAIEEAGLRYEVVDSANYDPEYPRFSIIDQDPPAGNEVKDNRKIYVTVNPSGYKKVTVPDVIQDSRRNATAQLRAVGLDIERVSYIDELGKDMVYRLKFQGKYISPGDKLPKTSKLELVCGNGTIPAEALIKAESED